MSPRGDRFQILLVEDNAGDVDLVREALAHLGTPVSLAVAADGPSALRMLFEPGEGCRNPDLILLDLNVPAIDGRQVLAAIRADERTTHIPVIVLSSSDADHDLLQSYRLHANCFLTKPADVDSFFAMFELIERYWFQLAKLPPATSVL